jgi:hypothetical protein
MMPTVVAKGLTQNELITEASIQGVNDAYLVIIGIGIIGLLMSFFIKKVKQASEVESNNPSEKAVAEKLSTN